MRAINRHAALVAGLALLAIGAAGASGAPRAPAPAAPGVGQAFDETVLDFRPRIGAPRGPSLRPQTHLHLYRQYLDAATGCQRQALEERRVGLVLSGGVSKGLAFVGALQALDEIGIRVDRVAGTSMGAVIGAFYAAGYPPDHLFNRFLEAQPSADSRATDVFNQIDWRTMFTDVPKVRSLTLNQLTSWGLGEGQGALPRTYQLGLRSGQNLTAELSKYLLAASAVSEGCFDDLYVPFVASATSVTNAATRRLTRGDLAVAVRASLSYPLLFTPTFIDGQRFIDGGMLDNFPVRAFIDERDKPEKAPPEPPATPGAARPGDYAVLLGFDVSDTAVSPLPGSSIFQAVSLKDAYSAIEAGIGASISRETRRSATELDPCEMLAPPKADPKPCMFRIKLNRPGGFTDFKDAQLADFVHAGRAMVLWKLCEALGQPPPGSWCGQGMGELAEGTINWSSLSPEAQAAHGARTRTLGLWIRQVLCQAQAGRCTGPWRHLLQETQSTLNSARSLPEVQAGFGDRAAALRAEIARVLGGGEVPPTPAAEAWPATLEGVELRWERGVVRLSVSPTLRDQRPRRDALLHAAAAQLAWLEQQLSRTPGSDGAEPLVSLDGGEVSRLTVGLSEHVLRVRVTGWTYRIGGLVRQRGLTEQGRLVDARLDYWGPPDAARKEHLERVRRCHGVPPESNDEATDCHPLAARLPWLKTRGGEEGNSLHVALDSQAPPSSAPPSPGPWWNQIWRHLQSRSQAKDEGLDVRYGIWAAPGCRSVPCKPPLPAELESLLERYHAVASVEHIRVEGIRPGLLQIGEKPTHRSPWGGLFFGYQYDYRNKHSFGMRYVYESDHDSRWKPTRVLLGLAANEPLSDQQGARLLDAKFLFLPSVDVEAPDFSLNPYAARRVHRIGDGRSSLSWVEHGISGTMSGRVWVSPDRWMKGKEELAVSWALSATRRWLDIERAEPLDEWRQRLQDPSIGLERRARSSLVFTQRVTQLLGEATLQYPVSVALHRTKGRDFSEVVGDFRLEWPHSLWAENQLVAARVFASRIKPLKSDGGDGRPPVPVPHDELYSAGGQYPFTERAAWGRKRFDYLGADLNQLWGSRAYGLETRASLCRIDGLSYFSPHARLQLDAVLQVLKIGFPQDPARRTRNAYGLIGSAYIPSLGSLRPRFSLAAGREFGGPPRVFASLDVLI